MNLYPRLPNHVAGIIVQGLVGCGLSELEQMSQTEHDSMEFGATGGHKVGGNELRDLRTSIRSCAKELGYPADMSIKTRNCFDCRIAEVLFETMGISANEASNDTVWQFLSCVLVPEIARWRFPGDNITSRARYLGGGRNIFQRLWWRAYLFRDTESVHPYSELGFLSEDELVQIVERTSISGYPLLVRVISRLYVNFLMETGFENRIHLMRDLMKRLMRFTPFIYFEAMREEEIENIVRETLLYSAECLGYQPDTEVISETIKGKNETHETESYDGSLDSDLQSISDNDFINRFNRSREKQFIIRNTRRNG